MPAAATTILTWVLASLALTATTTEAQFNGIATTYGPPDGESPQGGNCALMTWLDFAPRFHVAMNDKQWSSGVHCGRCVLVTCTDHRCTSRESVLGQITDRCPECSHGDLDMSLPMFHKITGYTTDRLTIRWEFVDCPVSGGVQVCAKAGSSKHWLYIQASNAVNGVASMNINGAPAPIFGSAYYFMSQVLGTVDLADTVVSMTSHGGDKIDVKVALQADKCTQIPQQFVKGSRPVPPPPAPPAPTPPAPTPPPPAPPAPTPPPITPSPPTQPPATPKPPTEPPATPKPPVHPPLTPPPAPTTSKPTTPPVTTSAAPLTDAPTTSAPTTATPTTTTSPSTAPTTTEKPQDVADTTVVPVAISGANVPNGTSTTLSPEELHAAEAPISNPSNPVDTNAKPSPGTAPASPSRPPSTTTDQQKLTEVSVRASTDSGSTSNLLAISFGAAFAMGLAVLGFVAYRSRRRVEAEKRRDRDHDESSFSNVLGKTTPTHAIAIL